MISSADFLEALSAHGVSFYTGVPDSLLKGLIATIEREHKQNHHIAANEGAALALAGGYHLATGGVPMVYLQNSGLGNLINPLTSLSAGDMYGLPALLVIGWRGQPGSRDEPQHGVMGEITPALLQLLNVPFVVLKKAGGDEWRQALNQMMQVGKNESRPAALLVEADVFAEEEMEVKSDLPMDSEKAIRIVYDRLTGDDIVVCTTGKIGRAFYKINAAQGKIKSRFLNIGSMGHAVSIATGLALSQSRRVVLFDGDGALLMHAGALALPPSLGLSNLLYVLLNNGAHQSVGGQPTLGFDVDFCAMAKAFGFRRPVRVDDEGELKSLPLPEHDFLEVRINLQTDAKLPRPSETPQEAKTIFMQSLGIFNQP